LEFGAYAGLDLVLASGQLHILGGIYYGADHDRCALRGFVDAGGCLNVIGLINANLEFYLGLHFTSPQTVEGECTVTVEIDYRFFSIDVHLRAHRTFSGGSQQQAAAPQILANPIQAASPTLIAVTPPTNPLAQMSPETWNCYYSKFAPEVN
jgi:hypothetical protein